MSQTDVADCEVEILEVLELAENRKGWVVSRPQSFDYQPGQYMLIEIMEDYGTPFSLASSPTEPVLKFATVIRQESELKELMDAKQPGEHFILSGPFGDLVYEDEAKVALVAGGIGVTPFVGILKYLTERQLPTQATLLYSCRSLAAAAFHDQLEELAGENEAIRTVYAVTADPGFAGHQGRIDGDFIRAQVPDYAERTWFVAGSPDFVASINHLLRTELRLRNIKLEVFSGY